MGACVKRHERKAFLFQQSLYAVALENRLILLGQGSRGPTSHRMGVMDRGHSHSHHPLKGLPNATA